MVRKSFASDNYAGVHPAIMQAVVEANTGECPSYGEDHWTEMARQKFKELFGKNAETYFVLTGTAANVLGLHMFLKPYQAVICPQTAHINVDECGAPEQYLGSKLLTVKTGMGKLTIETIEPWLSVIGNQHHVQPRVISLAQATELGTVYTKEELIALTDFAHKNNLLVHMDGARLCNAAATLNCSLKELTVDCGIDVLSFGGTKNGMMLGEAVIFFDTAVAHDFKYVRKQGMQLASKMRFISAQFIRLLSDNLWLENALHANNMACLLARELEPLEEIDLAYPVQSNAVFARLEKRYIAILQKQYSFYVWNEAESEVRWMTSFATQPHDVSEFAQVIKQVVKSEERKKLF